MQNVSEPSTHPQGSTVPLHVTVISPLILGVDTCVRHHPGVFGHMTGGHPFTQLCTPVNCDLQTSTAVSTSGSLSRAQHSFPWQAPSMTPTSTLVTLGFLRVGAERVRSATALSVLLWPGLCPCQRAASPKPTRLQALLTPNDPCTPAASMS